MGWFQTVYITVLSFYAHVRCQGVVSFTVILKTVSHNVWQDIDDSVDFRVLSSEKLQEILQFRIGQLKSFDEIRDAVEEFVESVVLYAGLSISHTYAFRDC